MSVGLSLTSPFALVGLLALPLIWWLQKRLRRPREVELPSLMFLVDEDEVRGLPRGRLVDADLLLALLAAALLALAAAGPERAASAPRVVVRAVVSGGGAGAAPDYRAAVRTTLATLAERLPADAVLDVTWEPAAPEEGPWLPRPSDDTLLAVAEAGAASRRLVLSDRAAPEDTRGVTWIALGEPGARNTGIVAVRVLAEEPALFVTLAHHGRAAATGRLALRSAGRPARALPFTLPAEGHGSLRVPLAELATHDLEVRLETADGAPWADDLAGDDRVQLAHGPLPVRIDPALPADLAGAVRRALGAALGDAGFALAEPPALAFVARGRTPPEAALTLELETVEAGAGLRVAPEGLDAVGEGPYARDLATAAGPWLYAPGAEAVAPGERVLLARRVGTRAWPVLLGRDGVVRLAPDPRAGAPAPIARPFWPLLVENLAVAAGAGGIGGGYRARGLLDGASSARGRVRGPLPEDVATDLRPAVPGVQRSLRPPLLALALASLALLWALPRLRRWRGRRSLRANPHAARPVARA